MVKQDRDNVPFDAPIPGQSLTAPLGDRPWQKPARYSSPDDGLAFYVNRITRPESLVNCLSRYADLFIQVVSANAFHLSPTLDIFLRSAIF